MTWRMPVMCETCPFQKSGPGYDLRLSLRPGRFREICAGLRNDLHFHCHKTTDETGDGSNLVCAGSLEWSEKHGVSQNLVRIMKRLDDWAERKEAAK